MPFQPVLKSKSRFEPVLVNSQPQHMFNQDDLNMDIDSSATAQPLTVESVPHRPGPVTSMLGDIRGNPQEQGTFENIARGAASAVATFNPIIGAMSFLESGVEAGNPLQPAGDMIRGMGEAYKRQFTGDAGGMTRGEAWRQQPVEEALNLITPALLLKGGIKAARPKAEAFMNMMREGSATTPAATEMGAGFNPLKYVGGKLKEKGLDVGKFTKNLANPLGTPEVVLKGKGIVEPFREETMKMEASLRTAKDRLKAALGGIQEGSRSDHRLFNELNTPGRVLSKRGQQVRSYLDDLHKAINDSRRARGQAEIPYREGYITHLIEDMPKEFAVDLQIPKELQFRFSERKGGLAHQISAIKALDTYTKAAFRDIHVGDALYKARKPLNEITKGKWAFNSMVKGPEGQPVSMTFRGKGDPAFFTKAGYAKSFVERQLGWPSKAARDIEALTGIRAQTTQKAALKVTSTFYNSLLGLAIDSGVKNLTQGVHTVAELGLAPSLKGYAKLMTKEGFKSAQAEHLLHEFEPFLLTDSLPVRTQLGKLASSILQSPMKFAEFVNRGAAYHAAMDVGLKKGMNPIAAHEFARSIVRKTQFAYGKLDVSPFMQGAITRPLAQFMTFPAKASEMLWQWGKTKGERGKLLRYLATTGAIVIGGKYAGIDVSSIFIDPTKMVDPDSKQGVPLPGSDQRITLDPSRLGTTGFTPQGLAPVPGTIAKAAQYFTGDEQQKEKVGKDVLRSIIPGGRFGGKVYDILANNGETRDSRDRLIRKDTGAESFLKIMGFRSTNREIESSRRENVSNIEKDFNLKRQKIVDTFISGDKEKAAQLRADLVKEYPYLARTLNESLKGMIKQERKRKNMTSEERFFNSKLRQRIEANQ